MQDAQVHTKSSPQTNLGSLSLAQRHPVLVSILNSPVPKDSPPPPRPAEERPISHNKQAVRGSRCTSAHTATKASASTSTSTEQDQCNSQCFLRSDHNYSLGSSDKQVEDKPSTGNKPEQAEDDLTMPNNLPDIRPVQDSARSGTASSNERLCQSKPADQFPDNPLSVGCSHATVENQQVHITKDKPPKKARNYLNLSARDYDKMLSKLAKIHK